MLSYFLYNSIIFTWLIQKVVNLVYMVHQTNKFQVTFQLLCSIFILINKVKRFSKNSKSYIELTDVYNFADDTTFHACYSSLEDLVNRL